MLDLNNLESKLKEALEKETPESLNEWLNSKRSAPTSQGDEAVDGEALWLKVISTSIASFGGKTLSEIATYLQQHFTITKRQTDGE